MHDILQVHSCLYIFDSCKELVRALEKSILNGRALLIACYAVRFRYPAPGVFATISTRLHQNDGIAFDLYDNRSYIGV